ncbi:MAG: HD domain-containing protein [Acidobacteriota bacterium]
MSESTSPSATIDWPTWEGRFQRFLDERPDATDSAHDLGHIRRVLSTAKRLAAHEQARLEVVVPAAWLHDCVTLPKNSPDRASASTMAADAASAFLEASSYPAVELPAIHHAIAAHSFSAGIPPETVEARVVQDADRLDALGAVGIARCMMVGGDLGLALHHPDEPVPTTRQPDDGRFIVDHFFVKLLRLVDTMQTAAGRAEAERRSRFMREYLRRLEHEIGG